MTQKFNNLIKGAEAILQSKNVPYVKYSGGNILVCKSVGDYHYMLIMFNQIAPSVEENLRFFNVRKTGVLKSLGQVQYQIIQYLS